MAKKCVICGNPGFLYYPFCKQHLEEKGEGKIVKCENCGAWHYMDRDCECAQQGRNACVVCGETCDDIFCQQCNQIVNTLPQRGYEDFDGAQGHFENMLAKIKRELQYVDTEFDFTEALCRLYLIAQKANEQFDNSSLLKEYLSKVDGLRDDINARCSEVDDDAVESREEINTTAQDDRKQEIPIIESDKNYPEGTGVCLICGEKSGRHKLCQDCWHTKESDDLGFVQKRDKDEIREHYFSHKNYLYGLNNAKFLYYGMIRLYKIAEEMYISYRDVYLLNLVEEDLKKLNERIVNKFNENSGSIKNFDNDSEFTETDEKDFRKIHPAEIFCKDGHYVRSTFEKILDDWLYDNKIFHCYEKRKHFGEEANQCVISDFYLPENDLYIELWGNIDKRYAKRKAAKIEIYNREGLKLLQVEDYECKDIESTMDRNVIKYGIIRHKS